MICCEMSKSRNLLSSDLPFRIFSAKIRLLRALTIDGVNMTISKILLNVAKSKVAADRVAKALSPEDLSRAIKNLQAAAAKIKKEEADRAARQRAANLKKLKSMMVKMDLSAADVRALSRAGAKRPKKSAAKSKAGPKKGTKVPPKYQLKVGKQTHKWTGRGRMPLVFKDHIAKGGSLDQCLIK